MKPAVPSKTLPTALPKARTSSGKIGRTEYVPEIKVLLEARGGIEALNKEMQSLGRDI